MIGILFILYSMGMLKKNHTGGKRTIRKKNPSIFELPQLRFPSQISCRYCCTTNSAITIFWSHWIRTSMKGVLLLSVAFRMALGVSTWQEVMTSCLASSSQKSAASSRSFARSFSVTAISR